MNSITNRQAEILKELSKSNILTSEQLANILHVSSRTIRNDIHVINQIFPDSISVLPSSGYRLQNKTILQKLHHDHYSEENGDTLDFKVLKKILSVSESNIDDLSEALFMSSTSLLRIIKKINHKLKKSNFNVDIIRRKNNLIMVGTEEEKRKVMSYYLVHEFSSHTLNITDYQNFFSRFIDLKELEKQTLLFFRKNNIRIKDIQLISFILHVTIMIDRILQEHNILYENDMEIDHYYLELGQQYYEMLQSMIEITFNSNELLYLASLFAGKINIRSEDKSKKLSLLIDLILKDINEIYGFDFQKDEKLKNNLLSHLVNLQNRVKYSSYLRNPMLEDIKKRFPILYDISVYMADQIQNYFHISLYEDEISYLTLHLMGSLERTDSTNKKSIVIVSPMGNSGLQYFKKRLARIHQYEIEIKDIISTFDLNKVNEINPDLIISFDDKITVSGYPVYIVKNLLNDRDIENIFFFLNNRKKGSDCLHLFEDELFFPKMNFPKKEQVISFLCSQLIRKGYVEEDYETLVLEREKVAPTAYGNFFAMPHPIKKEGLVNKIAVCTLNNAIDWNDKKVKIIFLICLSRTQQAADAFDELFGRISEILDDAEKTKKLMKTEDMNEFLHLFLNI